MNFQTRYRDIFGVEIDTSVQIPQYIRINTLRISEDALVRRLGKKGVLLEKVSYLKTGYKVLHSPFSLGSTPEYLLGYYYLQDAASQLASEVLDPSGTVCDMCAAPGSKTTHLCQLMDDEGVLIALDTSMPRIQSLRNNIERMGCASTLIYQKDARFLSDLGLEFDKILLDAPCSGSFCLDKDWFDKRDIEGIKHNAFMQRELLNAASDCLRPGGEILYSTCSLEPEEDEEMVRYARDELGLELLDIPFDKKTYKGQWGDEISQKVLRVFPGKTIGFFMAKLKRPSKD